MASDRTAAALAARTLLNLLSGVLAGIVAVITSVSLAALIFTGELGAFVGQGIDLALVTAVIAGVVVSVAGSSRAAIAIPQDRTAPVLAIMAASAVAALPATAAGDEVLFTVLSLLVLTSLLTGVFLLALGLARAGGMMRFMPYSVLGGFFAGTGWLLVVGGLRVMTGLDLVTLGDIGQLAAPELLFHWLPGLAVAALIYPLSRLLNYAVALPLGLFAATGAFFALALGAHTSIEQLAAAGWFLGPFGANGTGTFGLGFQVLLDWERWAAVLGQWSSVGTVFVISAVSILLTASALELLTGEDMDVNRELRAAGLANILAGLGGGMVGFHSLSISNLVVRLGGNSRLVGLVAAATCGVALLFGIDAIGYLPRVVLGGLLLSLGLALLNRWLVATWGELPLTEYLVIPLILVVVAGVGFIEGMLAGLLAALVLFVLNYSRTNVIRHELTGRQVHSTVERNLDDARLLHEGGETLFVLKLRGYLFFGTAAQLLSRVRERAAEETQVPLRFVVLDFKQVAGIDSSATYAFRRMRQAAVQKGFVLLFTGLTQALQARLHLAELVESNGHVRIFVDLDRGLEWCENRLLEQLERNGIRESATVLQHLGEMFPDDRTRERFLGYLNEQLFAKGESLIRQGDPSGDIYFLEEGEVSVYLRSPEGDTVRIRRTGSGTVLGEIGFYLGTPRSASVVADSPVRVYRLTAAALARMETERPDFAAALHRFLADLLAERLLHTTATLEAVLA